MYDCARKRYCKKNTDNKTFFVSCSGYGILGDGTAERYSYESVQVSFSSAHTFVSIASGVYHFMAVTADGQVFAWGKNSDGLTLGVGLSEDQLTPAPVVLPLGFKAVAADGGVLTSCLLGDDGTVRCWGGAFYGSNGDGRGYDIPGSTNYFPDRPLTSLYLP